MNVASSADSTAATTNRSVHRRGGGNSSVIECSVESSLPQLVPKYACLSPGLPDPHFGHLSCHETELAPQSHAPVASDFRVQREDALRPEYLQECGPTLDCETCISDLRSIRYVPLQFGVANAHCLPLALDYT